jgi:hypothetical protein
VSNHGTIRRNTGPTLCDGAVFQSSLKVGWVTPLLSRLIASAASKFTKLLLGKADKDVTNVKMTAKTAQTHAVIARLLIVLLTKAMKSH